MPEIWECNYASFHYLTRHDMILCKEVSNTLCHFSYSIATRYHSDYLSGFHTFIFWGGSPHALHFTHLAIWFLEGEEPCHYHGFQQKRLFSDCAIDILIGTGLRGKHRASISFTRCQSHFHWFFRSARLLRRSPCITFLLMGELACSGFQPAFAACVWRSSSFRPAARMAFFKHVGRPAKVSSRYGMPLPYFVWDLHFTLGRHHYRRRLTPLIPLQLRCHSFCRRRGRAGWMLLSAGERYRGHEITRAHYDACRSPSHHIPGP